MRHGYTLFFLAWGGVLILMALVKLVQGKALSEVVPIGCMGLIGIALAAGTWYFLGRQQTLETEPAPPAVVEAPKGVDSAALARQMAAHLRTALSIWLASVVLLSAAGVVFLHDFKYARTIGLLRFGALFWRCLLMALVAEAVLWLSRYWWVNDDPGPGFFSKIVTFVFAAVPVALVVLGAISLLNREDPWQALPGGPPFALRQFAAQHPQLRIETVSALGGDAVAVSRLGSPLRVTFSQWELRGALMSWEKCTDPSEVVRLGGPPSFRGSRCLARIVTLREDSDAWDAISEEDEEKGVTPPKVRTVRYVYSPEPVYVSDVTNHFLAWATSVGPPPTVYGYYSKSMEVTSGGKIWSISILGTRASVDDIYVDYTEGRPPAPAEDP